MIKNINDILIREIDEAIIKSSSNKQQEFLRPTLVSDECLKRAAYKFRWALPPEDYSAKTLRIFQTGLHFEDMVLNWLYNINDIIFLNDIKSNDQITIEGLEGHFKGHLDGLIEYKGEKYVLEIKSMNTIRFAAVQKKGMITQTPEYYKQIQCYMHFIKIDKCLFICVDKNTQDIYIEVVPYNEEFSSKIEEDSYSILIGDESFPEVEAYKCKKFGLCQFYDVCKNNAEISKNCRTCLSLNPTNDGNWTCIKKNCNRSFEEQHNPCDQYVQRAF